MPRSQAEVKLAHAVIQGGAKGSGMSKSYAKEVVGKMHGQHMSDLPKHAGAARNDCEYDCSTAGESVIDTDHHDSFKEGE